MNRFPCLYGCKVEIIFSKTNLAQRDCYQHSGLAGKISNQSTDSIGLAPRYNLKLKYYL